MRLTNWQEFNDSLIESRIPFTVEKSTYMIKFRVPYLGTKEYSFPHIDENSIERKELWFIQRVKKHVESLNLGLQVDRSTIRYIQTNPFFKKPFVAKNAIEIDLNSAYWNIAYREGIISEEIYNLPELKGVSKTARLMSLGALAKQKYIWTFDGKKWHTPPAIKSPTENYFFHCCKLTGEIMNQLKYICLEGFIFFWVDAIFIFPAYESEAIKFLNSINMPYKKYSIDWIRFENDLLRVKSKERELLGKEKEPRVFQLKKNDFDLLTKY